MAAFLAERDAGDAAELEIAPDELDAVNLFFSLDTQWRRHAMTGHRLGLEYGAVEPVARMLGLALTPGLFTDLRRMETAALEELARAL